MSEATKRPPKEKLVTVGVKVRPIERLALEQAAAEGGATPICRSDNAV